ARAALWAEHADHRSSPVLTERAGGPLADQHLLEREVDLLGRLGQSDRIVRADLEDPTQKTLRRIVREHNHGHAWTLLDDAADQEERALRIARAGNYEQVGRRFLKRGPALVDTA